MARRCSTHARPPAIAYYPPGRKRCASPLPRRPSSPTTAVAPAPFTAPVSTGWTRVGPTGPIRPTEISRTCLTGVSPFTCRPAISAAALSDEVTFTFTRLPPWWLNDWAYAGYFALSVLALAGFIAIRTRALRLRNEQLEAAVATRTRELHERNLELARLHQLELDEKISARLAEEKARLEVLRYQLNPHFLFNALNSVCAQIIRDPVAARAMVVRLADFCRLTLHRPGGNDEQAMTIAQELKLLRAYLEIEQARLGELITIAIESDPAAAEIEIPPVPAASARGERGEIRRLHQSLSGFRSGSHVRALPVLRAWKSKSPTPANGSRPGSHSAPSHGIGLENLRQRLARYYPARPMSSPRSPRMAGLIIRLRLLALPHEHSRPPH